MQYNEIKRMYVFVCIHMYTHTIYEKDKVSTKKSMRINGKNIRTSESPGK